MPVDRASPEDREQRLAAHLARAGELLRSEQFDAAERELAPALRLAPNDVRARNLLGLLRFRAGRYDEAFALYRELVDADPEDAALRLNLGLVQLRLGQHAEAAAALRVVIEKEPENQKAQGYLGLALMRAGDLHGARRAFLAGGQSDLARQAEEQIAAGSMVARLPVAPAPPSVHGLDGELPIEGGRPRAVEPRRPVPLSAFVADRELSPGELREPFALEGGLLVVRVEGKVALRAAGALSSSGRLSYAALTRRLRGCVTQETFGDPDDALVAATGSGTVVLAPPAGRVLFALALGEKDALYVREEMLVAFEESLYFENGRIPGSTPSALGGGGMMVQLRGAGRVVLRARRKPFALRLSAGDVQYVDQDALVGWTGEVVPQQLRSLDGQPTQFVACAGDGAILLDEPRPPEASARAAPVDEARPDAAYSERDAAPEPDPGASPAAEPPSVDVLVDGDVF